MKKVLIGCANSGVLAKEFDKLGWEAWECDILPGKWKNHIQDDVLNHINKRWDLAIFHPPCTHTSVSGARWFKEKRKDGRQQKAIKFFMDIVNSPIKIKAIEHPISIMSTIYKKPTQIIQPYMFGHGETKATCLWLYGLPKLIPTNIVKGREQRIWKLPPGKDRAMLRSITYLGIAKAMAEQWG